MTPNEMLALFPGMAMDRPPAILRLTTRRNPMTGGAIAKIVYLAGERVRTAEFWADPGLGVDRSEVWARVGERGRARLVEARNMPPLVRSMADTMLAEKHAELARAR